MTEQVKNDNGISIEATKLEETESALLKGSKMVEERFAEDAEIAAEAEALMAEAEATPEALPGNAQETEETPEETPSDEEPDETPKGANDGDMSIDYIEERIDELMTKGRAEWSKEERREYRRLDQALEAYESGESVESVAKADARGSKDMGEDAITEANFRKFDAMKASLDLTYGEENFFAKALIRTSNIGVRMQYGQGEETIYNVVPGDAYDGFRSGNYSYSWNESEATLSIAYQQRRLLDHVLGLEAIRVRVVEGLNIKKGDVSFVVHHDSETDETKIGNPTYTAKCSKGKGGVLGAKTEAWFPKGKIILSEPYVYEGAHGTTIIPSGEWKTIASMFDTKRDSSKNFSEENLNRNGGDWGALAKVHSSPTKTHSLHRKGYKNPHGATTGGRVIEGLLESMPVEQGKELAQLLKVQDGELSFGEVSPKFRKLFGYDDDDANQETTNNVIDGDVEGNE
jgi:hypothetical protein